MTTEERAARRAAIEGVRAKIGAVAEHAYEPASSCMFLTSNENRFKGMRGDVTVQVGKRQAAVLIVDGSNREASPEEIGAYHQAERDRHQAGIDLVNKAVGRAVVYLRPPASADESPAPVEESLARVSEQ